MQHDFGGLNVQGDDEDRDWQTIRAQALTAAIAMLPGNPKVGMVTELAWQLAHWIRHGELPELPAGRVR